MTRTVGPLSLKLSYRKPGPVRFALAAILVVLASGLSALAGEVMTRGLLKVSDQ